MKTFFREFFLTLLIAAIVFIALQATVQTFVVLYSSMEPNLHDGQRVLVNKAVYYFGHPRRGDVVVFAPPLASDDDYIKRIIGLPGERVRVESGAVFVNDARLAEPYVMDAPGYVFEETTVPDDAYFVLGDNRNNSDDSHNGWYVPEDSIVGKAWISIWPPGNWGTIPTQGLAEQLLSANPTN